MDVNHRFIFVTLNLPLHLPNCVLCPVPKIFRSYISVLPKTIFSNRTLVISKMKRPTIIYWIARLVASVILLQTLFFKFSGSEESVYIFTQVGIEPWGRIGVGMVELIAAVLLLIPSTVWAGSVLAVGLMVGAIGMHLTLLGIVVKGDGGQLFLYAMIVLVCSLFSFWKSKDQVPLPIKKILPSFLQ